MPGSQRMNSLNLAYFLYVYRWYFRIVFSLMILSGAMYTFRNTERKWIPTLFLALPIVTGYLFNFQMSADAMFKQPRKLNFKAKGESILDDSSIVVGVENNGEIKAYPIRFIAYHHQVQDVVGGKPVIVTYCSVCRTGRVFEPLVNGHHEKFRLVGMDHFNAMFEDATTQSWWRQATGEAVTGKLRGETLPEVESFQLTINKLFELYPKATVMQLDDASKTKYDSLAKFERGKSEGKLTRSDSLSWKDKSWVIGIAINNYAKAYDWNELKRLRIIIDTIGDTPIVLALSADDQSFVAFERPLNTKAFRIQNDTLVDGNRHFDFSGRDLTTRTIQLKKLKAYQEFWHSWKTFHPNTLQYP